MSAAVVSSRRVSAGIRPDPGATSRLPAWWGADDWLQEVADALGPAVCAEFHVAPDTVLAVARGHAEHADFRTGRGCRPTNARLVELVQVSLSTVQRARRLLKELGFVVELVRGRSIMSRAERLTAWRRGSSHRQVAAEFALCSRRRRAPKVSTPTVGESGAALGADVQIVDGDTPPGAQRGTSLSHLRSTHLRRRTETRKGAARPAPTRKGGTTGGGGHDGRTRRLAEAVQRRVRWLAGVSTPRTAPTLSRFARAGWTVRDVELGIRDALAARGWKVPTVFRASPAAYLATLLRELDPADRPTVLEEALAAAEAAERHFHDHLRVYGPPCPHGQPAGNVPSPMRGLILCPACRRAATS